MTRFLQTVAGVIAAALCTGCGGSWITGPLLMPPGLPGETATQIAESAPVPDNEWPKARPVSVRMYATGEVVVDVLVMMSAVEPKWRSTPGQPIPDSRAAFKAGYHTNGFNVSAKYHSSGREGSAIVIRTSDGREIEPDRAVLGEPPFESHREELHAIADWQQNIAVVPVTRGGMPYQACFVPVLLSGDGTLQVGDHVDVRIRPERGKQRYDIDDQWYRLEVKAMDPAASSIGAAAR